MQQILATVSELNSVHILTTSISFHGILPSLNFVYPVQWTDTNQIPATPPLLLLRLTSGYVPQLQKCLDPWPPVRHIRTL
jgi:hypothetical protein